MRKLLLAITVIVSSLAFGQTTTVYNGTVRDLTNAVVTSGQVTFTLKPSLSTTLSGTSLFSPLTVTCTITGAGAVKALDGTSNCTVVNNTSLTPTGTSYLVCLQPYFVTPGSCLYTYATGTTTDLSTVVPTPTTSPAFTFVDLYSAQTISGNKTFTGSTVFNGSLTFGSLLASSVGINALGTATSGSNFNSGTQSFIGSVWNGSIAIPDTWSWTNVIGSGTNGTSTLTATHSGSSGTSAVSVPGLNTGTLNRVRIIDGVKYAASEVGIQAAIADCAGPCSIWVLGTVTLGTTVNINQLGVEIHGFGYNSLIQVNHSGAVFNCTQSLFKLEDVEIDIIYSAATRAAAPIIQGDCAQGSVRNVRVAGNGTIANNGIVFKSTGFGATVGNWTFNHVLMPGGVTWANFALITNSNATTSAAYSFRDIIGSALTFTDAAYALDGTIDTARFENAGLDTVSGKVWDIRNTVGGSGGYPRWVHIDDSYPEAAGSTILNIQTGRDIQVNGGYFATATTAVAIGSTAVGVKIDGAEFVNIAQSGVTVAAGAIGTRITNNYFDDTCNQTNNTFDTIAIAANTANFTIVGNIWRNQSANKCRFGINIAAGTSTDYYVDSNSSNSATFGTSFLSDGGSGTIKTAIDAGGIFPADGTASAPAFAYMNQRSVGWYRPGTSGWCFSVAGCQLILANNLERQGSAGIHGWSSATDPNTAVSDAGFARLSSGVMEVTTSDTANSNGTIKAAGFAAGGAAASLSGTGACATFSTQTGGSNGGRATCTAATAGSTITITPGTTAVTGWICSVQDQTTRANLATQTSNNTTSCTLTATSITQNDVFVFTAMPF